MPFLSLLPCLLLAPGQHVGPSGPESHLTATYQRLRPAGISLTFGGRPVDLALAPDGKTLYLKDNRGLVAVDAAGWKVRQELAFPKGGGSLHGIAVSADGRRIYATNSENHLAIAAVGADGRLKWERQIELPGPKAGETAFPCGLALSADGQRAYVCLSRSNSLAEVDLTAGKFVMQIPVGVAPFDVALAPDGRTAFVSDWGGRHPKPGERSAKSAGTDTLIDGRGVASSGAVSVVDLAEKKEVAQIETGLHPSDLEMSANGRTLYVANANSDSVSVIDTATRTMRETIPVRPLPNLPFGSMPNALALARDGRTLFVANGGNNAVAVVSVGEGRAAQVQGFLPAGWYPGGVVADGGHLYIANIKGIGSRNRPANQKGYNTHNHLGLVNRVAFPDATALRRYTAQVRADARLPEILRAQERSARADKKPVPVPARAGEPSVFTHVVYIIKENRTYDQVFGDLKQGNGDPALCVFGREVTPNLHAIVEQFALLDNFYCNGVLSADGHSWATEGNVTDHLEKAFGGFNRSYTFGDDPITYSSSGFLWDNVLQRGLSFRNYGEMNSSEPVPAAKFTDIYRDYVAKTGKITFKHSIGIDNLRRYSHPNYPGWNMDIPDVLRADIFLSELRTFEREGTLPNLMTLYLPSDHTSGTSPGSPTPRAQVADNDLALGRIVEALSKSRFWPKLCIFVVEDDPQAGFDHVDGHRSPCLVISPYTRRGAVVRHFYNQTSVLHTIQRIFGLSPMNQMDSVAPLMGACFTTKADLRPYTSLPNRVPLDEMNPPLSALNGEALHWAQQSLALRFDRPDLAREDTLNRILWHASRKSRVPYPVQFAGAHGRGLKALRLQRVPEMDAEED